MLSKFKSSPCLWQRGRNSNYTVPQLHWSRKVKSQVVIHCFFTWVLSQWSHTDIKLESYYGESGLECKTGVSVTFPQFSLLSWSKYKVDMEGTTVFSTAPHPPYSAHFFHIALQIRGKIAMQRGTTTYRHFLSQEGITAFFQTYFLPSAYCSIREWKVYGQKWQEIWSIKKFNGHWQT